MSDARRSGVVEVEPGRVWATFNEPKQADMWAEKWTERPDTLGPGSANVSVAENRE